MQIILVHFLVFIAKERIILEQRLRLAQKLNKSNKSCENKKLMKLPEGEQVSGVVGGGGRAVFFGVGTGQSLHTPQVC